jgi:uncharacterized protein with beta-barrel porin domain
VTVRGNKVIINNEDGLTGAEITVKYEIVGGVSNVQYASASTAINVIDGNTITIDSNDVKVTVGGSIWGGVYQPGANLAPSTKKSNEVTNNIVTISGSGVTSLYSVYGGSSAGGKGTVVSGNQVLIDLTNAGSTIQGAGTDSGYVFGGLLDTGDGAEVENNIVTVEESNVATIQRTVAAAYVSTKIVSGQTLGASNSKFIGNMVTFGGGELTDAGASLYAVRNEGVNTDNDNARTGKNTYTGNIVNLTGGEINGDVIAVSTVSYGIFDQNSPNVVNITAKQDVNVESNVYGVELERQGGASYGQVNISGTTATTVAIGGNVAGGASGTDSSTSNRNVQANNNRVKIDGTSVTVDVNGIVAGGYSVVSGTSGKIDAHADENTVEISGTNTTIGGSINGGYVSYGSTSTTSDTFSANNNAVTVANITHTGEIVGGNVSAASAQNGGIQLIGNQVVIQGDAKVATVIGGREVGTLSTTAPFRGTLEGNTVTLNGATATNVTAAFGGKTISENSLTLDGATLSVKNTVANIQGVNTAGQNIQVKHNLIEYKGGTNVVTGNVNLFVLGANATINNTGYCEDDICGNQIMFTGGSNQIDGNLTASLVGADPYIHIVAGENTIGSSASNNLRADFLVISTAAGKNTIKSTTTVGRIEIAGGENTFSETLTVDGALLDVKANEGLKGLISISGGDNTFSKAVTTAGEINIAGGDNSFGTNLQSTASDINFSGGETEVTGTVNTAGNLTVTGGTNTLKQAVTAAGKVDVINGTNSFGSLKANGTTGDDTGIVISGGKTTVTTTTESTAALTVSGGENTLTGNVTAADLIEISGGDNNLLGNLASTSSDITFSGGETEVAGDVTTARNLTVTGGTNTLNQAVTAAGKVQVSDGTNSFGSLDAKGTTGVNRGIVLSGGSTTVEGTTDSDASLIVSGGTNTLEDAVTAAGKVEVSDGDNIFGSNVVANGTTGDNGIVFSGGESQVGGNLISATDLLVSDEVIKVAVTGGAEAGGKIDISAGENEFGSLVANGEDDDGGVYISGGSTIVEGGITTLSDLLVTDNAERVKVGGLVDAEGKIEISAGVNQFGSLVSKGENDAGGVYISGGSTTVDKGITSSTDLIVSDATQSLSVGEDVVAQGKVDISTGNNKFRSLDARGENDAGGVYISGGSTTVDRGITTASDLLISDATTSVKAGGDVEAGGKIDISAGDNEFGSLEAKGEEDAGGVYFTAGRTRVARGIISASDLEVSDATNSLIVGGDVEADGKIEISAGNNEFGSLAANGEGADGGVYITSGTTKVGEGISTGGDLSVSGNTASVQAGAVDAQGKISISSGNNQFGSLEADGVGSSGGVELSGGRTNVTGGVITAADLKVSDGTDGLTVGGGVSADGKVTVADGDNQFGSITANGTGTSGGVEFSGGTSLVRGNVTSRAGLNLNGGVNTFNGEVDATGTDYSGSGVNITKGTNTFNDSLASATSVNVTGDSTNVFADGIQASNGIYLNAGDNSASGAISPGSSNSVEVNDASLKLQDANVSGDLNLNRDSSVAMGNTSIAGMIRINGDSTVALTSASTAARGVSVEEGSTLDLGANTLTLSNQASMYLDDGSTVIFRAASGSSNSAQVDGQGGDLIIDGKVNVNFVGNASNFVNKEIFTDFANIDSENGTLVSNMFTLDIGENGQIKVESPNPAGYIPGGSTPNGVAAGQAIQTIINEGGVFADEMASLIYDELASGDIDGVPADKIYAQLIGEGTLNVSNAVYQVSQKVQGTVFNRLEDIRMVNAGYAPVAGSMDSSNRVWISGFGSWAKQKDTAVLYGYKIKTGGIALGYDRETESVQGLTLGISTAFSSGTLKTNYGISSVDMKTMALGLYGGYVSDSGAFFDMLVAYGWIKNKATVSITPNDAKHANFDGNTFQVGLRGGYDFQLDTMDVIPSVGVRYFNYHQDAFVEAVSGELPTGFANVVEDVKDDLIDIPVQVKIKSNIETGSSTIIPELRLGWTYIAQKPDADVRVGFLGSPVRYNLKGIQPKRSSYQVGAGLKVETFSDIDVSLNYDADFTSKFSEHRVSMELGYNF